MGEEDPWIAHPKWSSRSSVSILVAEASSISICTELVAWERSTQPRHEVGSRAGGRASKHAERQNGMDESFRESGP